MEFCQRAVTLAEQGGPDTTVEMADCLRQRGVLCGVISNYEAALNDALEMLGQSQLNPKTR